jgi:hypothetical protein
MWLGRGRSFIQCSDLRNYPDGFPVLLFLFPSLTLLLRCALDYLASPYSVSKGQGKSYAAPLLVRWLGRAPNLPLLPLLPVRFLILICLCLGAPFASPASLACELPFASLAFELA